MQCVDIKIELHEVEAEFESLKDDFLNEIKEMRDFKVQADCEVHESDRESEISKVEEIQECSEEKSEIGVTIIREKFSMQKLKGVVVRY